MRAASALRSTTDLSAARQRIWGIGQPCLWLVVGLLASYMYMYGPAFFFPNVAGIPSLPVPLFPPQAIILAVLLLTAGSLWWFYLLVYYTLQVTLGVVSGLPFWYAGLSNVANVIEPLLGAYLLTRLLRRPLRFEGLQDLGVYVACVVVASVVGASWGAGSRAAAGFAVGPSWSGWFLADVLASLVLAPAILLWTGVGWRGFRAASRARALEATLFVIALVGVGVLAFTTHVADPDTAAALLCVPIAAILWAAVRFGPRGVVTALSITTVLAIAGAANELGPFVGRSSAGNVLTLQVFLLGVGVPMLCLASLVSERGRAQERVLQSEQRYRAVVSHFPHAVVLLFGRDLRHVFADGPGLSEQGLSPASVSGRTLTETFGHETAVALTPQYAAAIAGASSTSEFTHQGRTFQAQALPLRYDGRDLGMLVMQEITEQRQAKLLAELDRARTIFFSNVSHELRTPLTLIVGPLEEALAHAESPLQREQLEAAERNAQRMLKLTNALLDFARIEAGRLDAVFELTDLPAFTADLAGAFRSAIEMAGLRLVVDCPRLPAGVEVYVDPDLWEKVVLNLISNALKFTFEGEIEVMMRTVERGSHVELRVRDTGVGIPPEEIPHLFERFYRIHNQRARTREGTGIGLALVQELCKLHAGSISAASQVGVGSTFTVRLPTGRAALPTDRVRARRTSLATRMGTQVFVDEALRWSEVANDDSRPESEWAPIAEATTEQPSKPRILVVDDNAEIRRYLVRLLSVDHAVAAVADSTAASRTLDQAPPDLVIVDVMLPGESGMDLVRAIRANPRSHGVPVLLLSARADEEARVAGFNAGADDYLAKPFAARELLARVGAHLALQHQRQRSLAAERQARDEADLARQIAERTSRLAVAIQGVTEALARAVSYAQIGQAVIQHALPVVGGTSGKLILRSAAGDTLESVVAVGYAEDVEEQYEHLALDSQLPGPEVIRTGVPMWVESATVSMQRFPFWSEHPTGSTAMAALPLVADGTTIGALLVGFPMERGFDTDDRAFLLTLATQCAAAVHRIQLYDSAAAAREQAEAALHARDEFLRTMVHDLKTPLTSLLWHSQVLVRTAAEGQPSTTNVQPSAAAVLASAQELMADIDEIHDLTRMEHGAALQLRREPVDLLALIQEVVATKSDPTGHEVLVVGGVGPLVVQADWPRLNRVLGNLLDNAFKYSERGSQVSIRVEAAQDEGRDGVVVHVTDQGVGIPQTDQPHVFDRYWRGPNAQSLARGEGIGLASARQLVEWHGGRLTVRSEEGAGSTFSMWLPRD